MQTVITKPPSLASNSLDLQTPFHPLPLGATAKGITIYDYFATVALQGLITHGMKIQADRVINEQEKDMQMAERAYRFADAMLIARNKALQQRASQA